MPPIREWKVGSIFSPDHSRYEISLYFSAVPPAMSEGREGVDKGKIILVSGYSLLPIPDNIKQAWQTQARAMADALNALPRS